MRTPLAPAFMVRWTACLMALRKAMRRVSCWAMLVATRTASSSGWRISLISSLTLRVVDAADLLAQRLDVGAALADDDARLGRVHGDRDVVDAALDVDQATRSRWPAAC